MTTKRTMLCERCRRASARACYNFPKVRRSLEVTRWLCTFAVQRDSIYNERRLHDHGDLANSRRTERDERKRNNTSAGARRKMVRGLFERELCRDKNKNAAVATPHRKKTCALSCLDARVRVYLCVCVCGKRGCCAFSSMHFGTRQESNTEKFIFPELFKKTISPVGQ